MIGRIYSAHPGEGKRFFLRMLLNHVTGCTSYQDIRTLPDGTACETFKEAALKGGLLEGDQESDQCWEEAGTYSMSAQLRQLFVTILLFNEPSNPFDLWDKYKASFAEDLFCHAKTLIPDIVLNGHILNKVLLDIEYRLQKHGKSLADFPNMPIPLNEKYPYEEARIIMDELDYNVDQLNGIIDANLPVLNVDQLNIYNIVIGAVYDTSICPKIFFVDGPGGTGKTFLYNTLLATVRSRGDIALAVASSGIAALLLQGGRTVHFRMKVPIRLNELSSCGISKQTALARLIRRTKLQIWDEAPMIHRHAAERIERSMRDLCSCDLPFGGKVIVFGGDFRQILPVVRHGTQADVVSACLNRSPLWSHVTVLKLTINMRLHKLSSQDASVVRDFSEFLLRVGEGR